MAAVCTPSAVKQKVSDDVPSETIKKRIRLSGELPAVKKNLSNIKNERKSSPAQLSTSAKSSRGSDRVQPQRERKIIASTSVPSKKQINKEEKEKPASKSKAATTSRKQTNSNSKCPAELKQRPVKRLSDPPSSDNEPLKKKKSSKSNGDEKKPPVKNIKVTEVVKTPKKRLSVKHRKHTVSAESYTSDLSDCTDVSKLLAFGEGHLEQQQERFNSESDEESDWEEVTETIELKEPVIPEGGVDITVEAPILSFKRKKKCIDLDDEVRKQLNRRQREIQEMMHKVHLLGCVASLKRINKILNSESVLSVCVSMVSKANMYPPKHADIAYLERAVKWFRKQIALAATADCYEDFSSLEENLCYQLLDKKAHSNVFLIFMFVAILRSLGLQARLIYSLQTVPLKPSSKKSSQGGIQILITPGNSKISPKPTASLKNEPSTSAKSETNKTVAPKKAERTEKRSDKMADSKSKSKKRSKDDDSNSEDELSTYFKPPRKSLTPRKGEASNKNEKETPKNKKNEGAKGRKAKTKESVSKAAADEENLFRAKKETKGIDRRVLSSDDEPLISRKKGTDYWVEVFLEDEEKWISVDVVQLKVHCVDLLSARATHPVAYVLAANPDCSLKDVTKRYVSHWHSDTRKRRVAETWWKETLWPYRPPPSIREKEEDEDIARQLEDMPLPTSLSEYKCHPLYALKRHLLKFEGIYPPEAPPLGFYKKEPVYARECVVTLRSRDIWYKEARVVRLKETPYKVVKSRPKFDKMTGEWRKDMPLELFGVWQTEDFIPPIAVDGKVPRNEYGNVDLFKPCMLPTGTVYLQIPGLIRVAKKLDIDCAPAVTGFEFHSGGCHPVLDGFVVCEEFKEVLLDAWDKDAEESEKRAKEKYEKRVYGNWRRLIRGLFIRERLKIKYDFKDSNDSADPAASSNTASSSASV